MAQERQNRKYDDLTVFWVRRDTECGECGEELGRGSWITLADDKAYCLSCADLDHLVFLPRGDAALTRRAKKHSTLHAVVLQWSRTRKQDERQGLLVEEAALDQAEVECLADADVREQRRLRNAERRESRFVGGWMRWRRNGAGAYSTRPLTVADCRERAHQSRLPTSPMVAQLPRSH